MAEKLKSVKSLALRTAARGMLFSVLASAVPGLCQSGVSYEPSQRMRTALETCMKDEVSVPDRPNCVKKCQPNFRLDMPKGKAPVCVATSAAAKLPAKTSPPVWVPPKPPTKVVPGS